MDIEEAKELVRRWAATKPQVRRAWVYGSRVRGDNKDDSDFDIAIELSLTGNDALCEWIFNAKDWRRELAPVFPWPVHLEVYNETTRTVAEGLSESSELIYDVHS